MTAPPASPAPEQNPFAPPRAAPEDRPAEAPPVSLGPRGIGGWLLLPLFGLIITPFRVTFETILVFRPVLEPGVWRALTTPGHDAYHPLWSTVIAFELVTNAALIVFTVVLLVLFFRKSRRVPRLMIVWYLSMMAMQLIDLALTEAIPAAAANGSEGTRDTVRAIAAAAIWVPYFLRSVRVRNTFVQ